MIFFTASDNTNENDMKEIKNNINENIDKFISIDEIISFLHSPPKIFIKNQTITIKTPEKTIASYNFKDNNVKNIINTIECTQDGEIQNSPKNLETLKNFFKKISDFVNNLDSSHFNNNQFLVDLIKDNSKYLTDIENIVGNFLTDERPLLSDEVHKIIIKILVDIKDNIKDNIKLHIPKIEGLPIDINHLIDPLIDSLFEKEVLKKILKLFGLIVYSKINNKKQKLKELIESFKNKITTIGMTFIAKQMANGVKNKIADAASSVTNFFMNFGQKPKSEANEQPTSEVDDELIQSLIEFIDENIDIWEIHSAKTPEEKKEIVEQKKIKEEAIKKEKEEKEIAKINENIVKNQEKDDSKYDGITYYSYLTSLLKMINKQNEYINKKFSQSLLNKDYNLAISIAIDILEKYKNDFQKCEEYMAIQNPPLDYEEYINSKKYYIINLARIKKHLNEKYAEELNVIIKSHDSAENIKKKLTEITEKISNECEKIPLKFEEEKDKKDNTKEKSSTFFNKKNIKNIIITVSGFSGTTIIISLVIRKKKSPKDNNENNDSETKSKN